MMIRKCVPSTLAIFAALAVSACSAADDGAESVDVLDEESLEALGSASEALTAAVTADGATIDVASAESVACAPRLSCADLATQLALPGLVVTRVEEVPASSGATPSYPAHCAVSGQLDARTGIDGRPYAIGFEMRLPLQNYNRRFFFQGGGGTDGVVVPAFGDLINTSTTNALSLGYAVVSTDGGHTGQTDPTFGLDPQARIDYGYNAVAQVTRAAKDIAGEFYGAAPRRSYFAGCSNGGRQAMVAAARFPEEFDGILAVDPGTNLPLAALAQAWDTQQFMSAAAPGQLPRDVFTPASMTTVAAHILEQCDALDGLEDGIVHDTAGCQSAFDFDRDVPTCNGDIETECLSSAQKVALANVFGGVRASSGAALYAAWPWDPGLAGGGWRFWKLDAGFAPVPFNTVIGSGALGYVFTTPPDQPDLSDGGLGYQLGLDMDASVAKIFARDATFTESAMEFMTPPNPTDLADLRARGGKLIVVHGTADPVFSSDDTTAWYRALLAADPDATSYARVFLVPGMNHCTGGPATDRFDLLPALDAWVEQGVAPDSVVAAVNPMNPDVVARGWPSTRTRPLCAFPAHAVLTPGATDTESASSFSCE
jgi:pimeloyl-ACP methyl ester carboxylesterase